MEKIYVWDRFVRVFHWTLVVLFCTSYLTGDEIEWLHVYSGYGIAMLILARTLWGFIGSTHARFKDFLYSPMSALEYLKSLASGNPKDYLGHNPAGAMMVFALLIGMFLTTLSGMKLYAIEEGKGPLAQQINVQMMSTAYADEHEAHEKYEKYEEGEEYEAYKHGDSKYAEVEEHDEYEKSYEKSLKGEEHEEGEEFWEETHEFAVNFMLLLVILHILGVILSSRAHGENLVKAMISGYKERSNK